MTECSENMDSSLSYKKMLTVIYKIKASYSLFGIPFLSLGLT